MSVTSWTEGGSATGAGFANVDYARVYDSNWADDTIGTSTSTGVLNIYNYGFSSVIPAGSTINGIEAWCMMAGGENVYDINVYLRGSGGSSEGSNQVIPQSMIGGGTSNPTLFEYGGSTNKWGWTDIDAADVRDSDFGIKWQGHNYSTVYGAHCYADTLRLRVYYKPPPNVVTMGVASVSADGGDILVNQTVMLSLLTIAFTEQSITRVKSNVRKIYDSALISSTGQNISYIQSDVRKVMDTGQVDISEQALERVKGDVRKVMNSASIDFQEQAIARVKGNFKKIFDTATINAISQSILIGQTVALSTATVTGSSQVLIIIRPIMQTTTAIGVAGQAVNINQTVKLNYPTINVTEQDLVVHYHVNIASASVSIGGQIIEYIHQTTKLNVASIPVTIGVPDVVPITIRIVDTASISFAPPRLNIYAIFIQYLNQASITITTSLKVIKIRLPDTLAIGVTAQPVQINQTVNLDAGQINISGQSPRISRTVKMGAVSLTSAGQAFTLFPNMLVNEVAISISVQTLQINQTVNMTGALVSADGQALIVHYFVLSSLSSVSVSAQTIKVNQTVNLGLLSISISSQTILISQTVPMDSSAVGFTGQSILINQTIRINLLNVTATCSQLDVVPGEAVISPAVASISLDGSSFEIIAWVILMAVATPSITSSLTVSIYEVITHAKRIYIVPKDSNL